MSNDIRLVAQFGNIALFSNPYGVYVLTGNGNSRVLMNADARRLEYELLIQDGCAACSRRVFECVAGEYLQ